MEAYSQTLTIKSWAEADRPREKLLRNGRKSLTNAELLAIVIGSGTTRDTAVELGRKLLAQSNNDLAELSRQSISQLCKIRGIGPAKAVSIAAALELGSRRADGRPRSVKKITSSIDAFLTVKPHLMDLDHEEFWITLVSRSNRVLKTMRISSGGVSATVVDAKMIFKPAIEILASGVILAHNHPSGNLRPSQSDKDLTKKLIEAGNQLDINVLDHIIVAGTNYLSFRDESLF